MRISKKTDYALRALFTLVDHYGGVPVPIWALARRNDAPKRFLEQIMLNLKTQGWVDSTAGIRGGYILAKNPSKITMGEVVRYFDGILAPIDCVSVAGYKRCSDLDSTAGIRGGYILAKNPSKITMGEVVRYFDGILAPIDCVSVAGYKRC